MKRKHKPNEFPKRVLALYLLFSLLGMVSMLVGILVVQKYDQAARKETHNRNLFLTHKSKMTTARLKKDLTQQQILCDRFVLDPNIQSCSVYSLEGSCAAHSEKSQIGQSRIYYGGTISRSHEIEMLDVADSDFQAIEYSAEMLVDGKSLGTLVVMFAKHSIWPTASELVPLVSLVFWGPLALILIGGFWLYRQLKPIGSLHNQLVNFSLRPSLPLAEFKKVDSTAAVAHGWNSLVHELGAPEDRPDLKQRLISVVESRKIGRHESAVDSLPDGIAETDIDGHITFINNAMAAILGEPDKESLIGTSLAGRLDVENHDELAEIFDERSQSRQVVTEMRQESEIGKRVLRIGKHPIAPNSDDPRAGQAWCVRDVTQQKLAEKARDEFLNSATHELRTPLANIKAYAETLTLSEVSDIEQQKDFCNIINSEATRLARFIDELLDVSSIEAGSIHATMQRVEVARLLDEVVKKVQPLMIQKNIQLETLFGEKLPELSLDKEKFSICLVNLLGNAAKYTPEDGHVVFKAQVAQGQLFITVSDNGIGISDEDLPRIFDKFFRSDDERVHSEVGTGLGLAFSYEVAKLHDAKLSVESELNEGTTFTLQLNIPREVKSV